MNQHKDEWKENQTMYELLGYELKGFICKLKDNKGNILHRKWIDVYRMWNKGLIYECEYDIKGNLIRKWNVKGEIK